MPNAPAKQDDFSHCYPKSTLISVNKKPLVGGAFFIWMDVFFSDFYTPHSSYDTLIVLLVGWA